MNDRKKQAIKDLATQMSDYVIEQIDATRSDSGARSDFRSELIDMVAEGLEYYQGFDDPKESFRNFLANWTPPAGVKQ
jgi:hypothetical protein